MRSPGRRVTMAVRSRDRQPCRRGLDTRRWTMKAIVVTDQAAGTAGMTLVERPEPQAAINDVVVQVYASGFVGTALAWPSTWTDRLDRDRKPRSAERRLGTEGVSTGSSSWYTEN